MVTGKYLQTHELWMTCGKLGLPTDRFGSICYAFPLKAFLGWRKGPGDEAAHLLLHILSVGLRVKEIAVEKSVAGSGGAGLGGVFGISAGSFER